MQMETTYGIFDNEADHIIVMVHDHAPLDDVIATDCPACGAKMVVAFNSDGTGFSLSCMGDPLHMTTQQEIEIPPPWWQQCYKESTDTTWYWREWHSYDDDGTLHMKMSGWKADNERWSGELECQRGNHDYDFWQWILNESGCKKELISDSDLDQLRSQYQQYVK